MRGAHTPAHTRAHARAHACRHRHLPKAIYKAAKRKREAVDKQRRKAANRAKNSREKVVDTKATRVASIVREEE